MGKDASIPIAGSLFQIMIVREPITDEDDGKTMAFEVDDVANVIKISHLVPPHRLPEITAIAVNEIWKARTVPLVDPAV
jgi:hypothetical protein